MTESSNQDKLRKEIAALLPRLRRFGRTLARNPQDADDVVQIAVERALTHTAQWQPGTRLGNWIFRIMQNAWIDETRARERRSQIFVPEEAGDNVGASTNDAQMDAIAVNNAVAQLGDDQRAVVGLVFAEGFSYQEAVEVLHIPVGTLTSRLARARDTLQTLLGGGCGRGVLT